jgi:hypothetical protein
MFNWENSPRVLSTAVYGQGNFTRIFSLSPPRLHVLQTKMSDPSLASLADCRQFVVQFPEFARLFQVSCLLQSYLFGSFYCLANFYIVRLLLGLSWDDIMATFSTLRQIVGGGTQNQVIAGTITILALAVELYPIDGPSVASNLAVGLLQLIQRIGARDLPILFW